MHGMLKKERCRERNTDMFLPKVKVEMIDPEANVRFIRNFLSISSGSPQALSTTCVDSHAVEEFCFRQAYFVMNSPFLESDVSAMEISSSR